MGWTRRAPASRSRKPAWGYENQEHPMPRATSSTNVIATIGIDIGKNAFHVIGLDDKGAIILRHKLSRGQVYARLANIPPCLIGMEACVGAHHLGRQLSALGHDTRLMPARYVRPYSKGQKNDFRDAEAIAEAVQRPTMKFVAIKTVEQLDLQGLHRIRERLVCQRTSVINQIRAFLLERGIAVRQGLRALRTEMPIVLARTDKLSQRMIHMIEDLCTDWRHLDKRIETVSKEIETLSEQDDGAKRLMTVPGIGPIISIATVAAIGTGEVFSKGRDFGAWLGLVPKQMSTGGRTILGPISKRGNRYLRMLFVQAARAVLLRPQSWEKHGLKLWIEAAARRLNRFKLGIALANKITRIAWGVLSLTFSLATHGGSIHWASPVLPLEANSRLALSTLIKIESPPSGNVFCKSMAGGSIFSRPGHPPGAAALDFCNMLPPIDRSTVTLRAGTLLAST